MTATKKRLSLLRKSLLAERDGGLNYRNYTLYPLLIEATCRDAFGSGSALSLISALVGDLCFPYADRRPSNPVAQAIEEYFGVSSRLNQDMNKAIARLAFAPVTDLADEANFIRILQINEIIFSVIASGCEASIDNPETMAEFISSISRHLSVATVAVQAVMQGVSPAGFHAFTAVTGNISAIESENFACLEAHLTNVSEERLQSALFKMHPRAVSIVRERRSFIGKISDTSSSESLRAHMRDAERLFVNWKRLHLASMIKTLGPERLNREAVSYLQRFISSTGQVSGEPPSLNAAGGANDA